MLEDACSKPPLLKSQSEPMPQPGIIVIYQLLMQFIDTFVNLFPQADEDRQVQSTSLILPPKGSSSTTTTGEWCVTVVVLHTQQAGHWISDVALRRLSIG